MEEKEEGGIEEPVVVPSLEELSKEIERLKDDKSGMTEQIKELRKRAQEAEDRAKQTIVPEDKQPQETDVQKAVQQVLQQERSKEAERNRALAFEKFLSQHKEFHPENDGTGMKQDALRKAFSRLNVSTAVSIEEFTSYLSDAARLSGIDLEKSKNQESVLHQFATMPLDGGGAGKKEPDKDKKLTPEQEKIRKERGWSIEKYIETKSKHPTIVP